MNNEYVDKTPEPDIDSSLAHLRCERGALGGWGLLVLNFVQSENGRASAFFVTAK